MLPSIYGVNDGTIPDEEFYFPINFVHVSGETSKNENPKSLLLAYIIYSNI